MERTRPVVFRGGIGLDELDRGVVRGGGGDDLRLKSHTTISSHTSFQLNKFAEVQQIQQQQAQAQYEAQQIQQQQAQARYDAQSLALRQQYEAQNHALNQQIIFMQTTLQRSDLLTTAGVETWVIDEELSVDFPEPAKWRWPLASEGRGRLEDDWEQNIRSRMWVYLTSIIPKPMWSSLI